MVVFLGSASGRRRLGASGGDDGGWTDGICGNRTDGVGDGVGDDRASWISGTGFGNDGGDYWGRIGLGDGECGPAGDDGDWD